MLLKKKNNVWRQQDSYTTSNIPIPKSTTSASQKDGVWGILPPTAGSANCPPTLSLFPFEEQELLKSLFLLPLLHNQHMLLCIMYCKKWAHCLRDRQANKVLVWYVGISSQPKVRKKVHKDVRRQEAPRIRQRIQWLKHVLSVQESWFHHLTNKSNQLNLSSFFIHTIYCWHYIKAVFNIELVESVKQLHCLNTRAPY